MFHWTYRDSGGALTDLIPLFQHTLQLCQLHEGEQVMVYGDHHTPTHYAKAAMAAAQRRWRGCFSTGGAHRSEAISSPGRSGISGTR